MKPLDEPVTGGMCPAAVRWHGSMPFQLGPHKSTAQDIDASRFVPVHICDRCRALFVPERRALPTQPDDAPEESA